MPRLSLIVGPPNSGRAVEMETRLRAALGRDPVLVVPTGDDVAAYERRLCGAGGAIVGVSIRTFRWLVDDVAAATGTACPPPLSAPQRQWLVASAASEAGLRLLARSARRRGFVPALDRLIDELQAALVTPEELVAAAAATGDDAYERELAGAYACYLELRERSGRADAHTAARAATASLRERPEGWADRPVFLYGFDDLTEEQLELIAALAAATEVTVAVNYEDSDALVPRAELLARLTEDLGATIAAELPYDASHTASAVLRHLDRRLFEPGAPRVAADEGLALLESAGERGEAEAIGARIARLLADGVPADEILVVLRSPERHGKLYARVLAGLAIPVAVEAEVPLARTAAGRGLLALARAAGPGGTAEDLLAFMRARSGAPPGIADRLERRIRREGAQTPEEATEGWRTAPRVLARLRDAGGGAAWLVALAGIARKLAEEAHAGREPTDGDERTTPFDPLELRAGHLAASALEELAAMADPGPPSPAAAIAALEAIAMPLWRGSTEGRVRVLSPYRARAARARHVFCASLQDGEFPAGAPGDPLLGDQRRAALGIGALTRQEPAAQERYLFHACVSRPVERLWLSWRSSDEEGRPAARSPFVDDVLDLLEPEPGTAEERLVERRGLDRVVFAPDEAPTERLLARALAPLPGAVTPAARIAALGLDDERARAVATRVEAAIEAAGVAERDPPGPLRAPAVLAALARRNPAGAGTLEKWIECPYRWFVDHELDPQRLEPSPEPLTAGSIVHTVLERLYREPPGDDSIPRPPDLERWCERSHELLAEECVAVGLGAGRPLAAVTAARIRAQIDRFLTLESCAETSLRPRLVEASFGEEEGALKPPLELGATQIHGKIDRVDVTLDGRAGLVRDYKTSAKAPPAAKLAEEGKLQLQLYSAALRELWEIEPIGAVYHPLARRRDPRPRGVLLQGSEADGVDAVGPDRLPGDDFRAVIDAGVARAEHVAGEMRDGRIGREPNGGSCPAWCRYQPICRLQRAIHEGDGNGAGEGGTA